MNNKPSLTFMCQLVLEISQFKVMNFVIILPTRVPPFSWCQVLFSLIKRVKYDIIATPPKLWKNCKCSIKISSSSRSSFKWKWEKWQHSCLWNISRASQHMKVSDGSFFWISFHALLFEANSCWPWNSPNAFFDWFFYLESPHIHVL